MPTFNGFFNWSRNRDGRFTSAFFDRSKQSPQQRMEMLDIYYDNNDLYEDESSTAYWLEEWLETIKPFRTPVHRSIEFYASKMCQGKPKVQVLSKNNQTLASVEQVLADSNFMGQKGGWLRKNALYGNTFLKCNFNGEKTFITKLDAKTISNFEEDNRGYLKWIRIDVKQADGKWYTEYWSTDGEGYVAIYKNHMNKDTSIEQLGTPDEFHFLEEFGTHFIPIIHIKFKDVSEKWGRSAVDHAVTKIDEVNREYSNLADTMFQADGYWVITTGVDKDGISIPPPDFEELTDEQAKILAKSKTKMLRVGGADAKWSVQDYAWSEWLAVVQSTIEEIEKDMPELRYFTLKEVDNASALRTLLAGAIDRAKEAEDNFVDGLMKAIKICLSMGKFYGLFPASIGEFDRGDFDMSLAFDEIVPSHSQQDKATTLAMLKDVPNLPLAIAMQLAGYSAEEVAIVPVVATVLQTTNVDQSPTQ